MGAPFALLSTILILVSANSFAAPGGLFGFPVKCSLKENKNQRKCFYRDDKNKSHPIYMKCHHLGGIDSEKADCTIYATNSTLNDQKVLNVILPWTISEKQSYLARKDAPVAKARASARPPIPAPALAAVSPPAPSAPTTPLSPVTPPSPITSAAPVTPPSVNAEDLFPEFFEVKSSTLDIPSAIACFQALQRSTHHVVGFPEGYAVVDAKYKGADQGAFVFTDKRSRYYPFKYSDVDQRDKFFPSHGQFVKLFANSGKELEKNLGDSGDTVAGSEVNGFLATYLVRRMIQLEHEVRSPAPEPTPLRLSDFGQAPYETVDAAEFKKALLPCEKIKDEDCGGEKHCVKELAKTIDGQISRHFPDLDYSGNTLPPESKDQSGSAQ